MVFTFYPFPFKSVVSIEVNLVTMINNYIYINNYVYLMSVNHSKKTSSMDYVDKIMLNSHLLDILIAH